MFQRLDMTNPLIEIAASLCSCLVIKNVGSDGTILLTHESEEEGLRILDSPEEDFWAQNVLSEQQVNVRRRFFKELCDDISNNRFDTNSYVRLPICRTDDRETVYLHSMTYGQCN